MWASLLAFALVAIVATITAHTVLAEVAAQIGVGP